MGTYNYWIYIILMMIGFYGVLAKRNLIKKVISLGLFQTAIFLLFISMAVVEGGVAPIHPPTAHDVASHAENAAHGAESHELDHAAVPSVFDGDRTYVNPLPHVLILTAIVVSISVTAVALGIVILIKQAYGTIEVDEIESGEVAD